MSVPFLLSFYFLAGSWREREKEKRTQNAPLGTQPVGPRAVCTSATGIWQERTKRQIRRVGQFCAIRSCPPKDTKAKRIDRIHTAVSRVGTGSSESAQPVGEARPLGLAAHAHGGRGVARHVGALLAVWVVAELLCLRRREEEQEREDGESKSTAEHRAAARHDEADEEGHRRCLFRLPQGHGDGFKTFALSPLLLRPVFLRKGDLCGKATKPGSKLSMMRLPQVRFLR